MVSPREARRKSSLSIRARRGHLQHTVVSSSPLFHGRIYLYIIISEYINIILTFNMLVNRWPVGSPAISPVLRGTALERLTPGSCTRRAGVVACATHSWTTPTAGLLAAEGEPRDLVLEAADGLAE